MTSVFSSRRLPEIIDLTFDVLRIEVHLSSRKKTSIRFADAARVALRKLIIKIRWISLENGANEHSLMRGRMN